MEEISLPRGCEPLDFSFKCLCSLNDLKEEVPRPREGKIVKSRIVVETVAKERPDNFFDVDDFKDENDVHFTQIKRIKCVLKVS